MLPSCARPAQSGRCSRKGRKILRTEGLFQQEANVHDHRPHVLARWSCRGALIAAALVSSCGFFQLGIHATSAAIARSLRRPRTVVQPRTFWTRPFAIISLRLRGGGDSACDYRQDRLEKGQRALSRELRRAADGGDMPALRRALKQGAEVDAVDCSGFTALHLAAEKGHSDIVDELLAKGASVHRREEISGWTPLHAAAFAAKSSVLAQLVAHGAALECLDHAGATPMLLACRAACATTIRTLYNLNASITCTQPDGTDVRSAVASNAEITLEERDEVLDLLDSLLHLSEQPRRAWA